MADVDLSEFGRQVPTWTDERVEILTSMWAAGESGSRIARELGVTSNSVIGKIHRLGLSTRDKQQRKPEAQRVRPSRAKPKPVFVRPPRIESPAASMPRYGAPEMLAEPQDVLTADAFDAAIPRRQRKTIWQLTEKTCRYPVGTPGTPGFFFCGGKADNAAGQVYCSRHMAVCFRGVPSKPRHEFRGRG